MSLQRSLLRALPRSTALLVPSSRPLVLPFLLRSNSSSSSPSTPPSKPKVRPPLRSLAQIKADKAVEQLRLDTLAGTGWSQSKEKGQEDQEERTVFNRPSGQSNGLIWGFLISQVVCLVCLIDLQSGTTFILPKPLPPRPASSPSSPSHPLSSPQPYVPTSLAATVPENNFYFDPADPTKRQPDSSSLPLATIDSNEPYKPPYFTFFLLTVVCVGLPMGLLQGWAKASIVQIKSLRPSGRFVIRTKRDSLMKWVQKEDGRVVDVGIATETKNPDGRVSKLVALYLPLGRNGAGVTRRIDVGPPSSEEMAVAGARGQKVIVSRDLISQAFGGIKEVDVNA